MVEVDWYGRVRRCDSDEDNGPQTIRNISRVALSSVDSDRSARLALQVVEQGGSWTEHPVARWSRIVVCLLIRE